MKKLTQSLLIATFFILGLPVSSFAEKAGPDTQWLYNYLSERMDLPGLDQAGSGCQIELLELKEDGTLDLQVRDLNKVLKVTLLDDGEERISTYNGADTDIIEYTYVFDKVLMALDAEDEIKHLRLQHFNPETGEVFEQIDCVNFPL